MLDENSLPKFSQLKELEKLRQNRVILLAVTSLEIDLLPVLYETLAKIGPVERLDLVLYCRGGIVNASRRIALLLQEFTNHLTFLVPHYCESSSTLLILAAHEIIAGSLAIFSPIDPHLSSADLAEENSPLALSSQDIRLFNAMSKDWFGLEGEEARVQSFSVLCNNIFPTTLTSFHRATLEVQTIGEELLAFQLPDKSKEFRTNIVNQLLFGYHSHSYALTWKDMQNLGLLIKRRPKEEALAWEISCEIRAVLGAGVCESLEDGWCDSIIATRDYAKFRYRKQDVPAPVWQSVKFNE